jgi:hypothetical protein
MTTHCHVLVYPAGRGTEAETLLVTARVADALRALDVFAWASPDAHAVLYVGDLGGPRESRPVLRVHDGVWRLGVDVPFLSSLAVQQRRATAGTTEAA